MLQKEDEAAEILFSIYDVNHDKYLDQAEIQMALENSALPVLREILSCQLG